MTRILLAALLALLLLVPSAHAGEPDATLPAYDVTLQGSEGGFRWQGRETLTITNPGAAPLDRIWVRLWGNGARGCAKGRRAVDISPAEGTRQGAARCTAVELLPATPIAPGARGSVAFDVDIRVPRRIRDRFGKGGERMALVSNALPALAHLERGRWRLDRWFGTGEAWTYPAAEYAVRLQSPPGVAVAAPGVLQPDGSRRLSGGRDYSWAAGRMHSTAATVDGVAVRVWGARGVPVGPVLRIVRERLPRLARLFGAFAWPDLQVVITNATAMEHTGLIMTPPEDYVIVHELAHEWWFGSVGNDQAQAPWLDEGFATYAEEAVRGQRPWCRRPGPGARLATRGIDHFRGRPIRYGVVYFEGACLLDMLEKRMGRARFRAALRDYAVTLRYGWSTAARFRAAMDAASPVPLGALWRRYGVQ